MIGSALGHIRNQLNQYLRNTFDLNEDVAVLSNILDQDGSLAPGTGNKLVLFIVNLEKESMAARPPNSGTFGSDRTVISSGPVYLNVYLMVAANFADYQEALKFISNTIAFFQRSPVLDHQNTPDMDRRIGKLVLDIENLNMHDLSTLWGVLSGRYLPSILYKVRMVVVDPEDVRGVAPTVRQPETAVKR